MVYPLITFIKYIFGDRISATKLLSNITPKRMIGYHIVNIIIASIFALLISKFIVDLIKLDEAYTALSEYITFSSLSMFNAYLPMLILSYILFVIFLIILSLFYHLIAKLFQSTINFKTTFYSIQFLSILHPLFHLTGFLIMFSNTAGLASIVVILTMLVSLVLVFTLSKQYAQVSGLTTITIFLINLLIGGLIVALIVSAIGIIPVL